MRPARDQPRPPSAPQNPFYLISRLAVMVVVVAVITVVYIGGLNPQSSGLMAAAIPTGQSAIGKGVSSSQSYDLFNPADVTAVPIEAVADSETDVTPTPRPAVTYVPAQASLCGEKQGKVIADKIKSKTLAMTLAVDVYVPPCYNKALYTYPTLYLIQGLGYTQGQWVNDGVDTVANRSILKGQLPPFIMVMPANDWQNGAKSRFAYTRNGPNSWEGFIVNELIPYIDKNYSTWGNREGRAIGGISRGGYWSLEIAFLHTDLFSAVGGHSPAITSDFLIGTPDDFNMLDLVRSTDTLKNTRIFLDSGSGDVTQQGVFELATALGAKQLSYVNHFSTGKHDDVYWSSQLDTYLRFYTAAWPVQPKAK